MRALGAFLEDVVCFVTAELLGAVEEEHVSLSSSSSTTEFCFSFEGMQNRCKSLQHRYLWVVTAEEPLPGER